MKKALISPNEKVYDYKGDYLGERIAEVSNNEFPIAPPLYWIDCDDNVNAMNYYYDNTNDTIVLIPVPLLLNVTYEQKLNIIIEERNLRLQASDWTQLADAIANHNQAWLDAWNVYRQELRDFPATITQSNIDNLVYPIPPQ
jgi:hypothetical protein